MELTEIVGKLVVVTTWNDGIYWGYLTAYDVVDSWVELERVIGTKSLAECCMTWSGEPRRVCDVYSVRLANELDEFCMKRTIEL